MFAFQLGQVINLGLASARGWRIDCCQLAAGRMVLVQPLDA
jgi:hypothetical protein